ncbi:MAG TPA: glycosyltransferase [Candidatus Saccharimonadia bacterium]
MVPGLVVSVIVPTRNSQSTLGACLASIRRQTYPQVELIVVDRDSTDGTPALARRYTRQVYNHGPERSAQRNFGVGRASGAYVCVIDADMELAPEVLAEAVAALQANEQARGVIIPEESFGEGFWARCKALERSFYNGFEPVEAARFMSRQDYLSLGGFDSNLVAGEDWDLSQRLKATGPLVRTRAVIRHNEQRLSLVATLRKKYYYAHSARAYLAKHPQTALAAPAGPLQRYKLFLSKPGKLFRNPVVGLGVLFMKTAEFAAGAIGYFAPR